MTTTTATNHDATTCEFCGEALEPIYVTVGGKSFSVGYKPCSCPAATEERLRSIREADARKQREEAERKARRYAACGIPKRYLLSPTGGTIARDAQTVADEVLAGRGYYLCGTQGTGKTAVAMTAARMLIDAGKRVRVEIAPKLMERIRDRESGTMELADKLARVDVLVLDDLGKESPTAYACERLFDVINDRYNAMLPVIATSNYTRSELAKRLTEGDVGRSIASRLAEMTTLMRFDGTDRRLRHG